MQLMGQNIVVEPQSVFCSLIVRMRYRCDRHKTNFGRIKMDSAREKIAGFDGRLRRGRDLLFSANRSAWR